MSHTVLCVFCWLFVTLVSCALLCMWSVWLFVRLISRALFACVLWAVIGWKCVLYESIKRWAELKLSHHLPNCAVSGFLRDFSPFFIFNWKWNFGTGKSANSNRITKQRFVNMVTIHSIKERMLLAFIFHFVNNHLWPCWAKGPWRFFC